MTLKAHHWASLVVQWVRIHPPTQGTRVRSLVQEDPVTKPEGHKPWACGPRACAPRWEKPPVRSLAPQRRPTRQRTPSRSSGDPALLKVSVSKHREPFKTPESTKDSAKRARAVSPGLADSRRPLGPPLFRCHAAPSSVCIRERGDPPAPRLRSLPA